MDCCKIPDYVQQKLDQVRKELRVQKLNELMRVAAELSWNGWKDDEVVKKLHPEFIKVKKVQGDKLRCRLKKIAQYLTRELKGLKYNFPPLDTFCSLHMWIAKDASVHQQTAQKRPRLKQTTIQQFSVEISSSDSDCSNTIIDVSDEDVAKGSSQFESNSSSPSSPVSKRMKSTDQIVDDLASNTPSPATESTPLGTFPDESASVSDSQRVIEEELVVQYDPYDAEITANLLSFLTSTFIDWSVISHIFSYLVIHALKLRASRLNAFCNENCAHVGRRMENAKPMLQSQNNTLQDDSAIVSQILAKFEPAYQTLLDVFQRHLTLSEELPMFPEEVSSVASKPITVRWDIPNSLSPFERMKCRGEWMFFDSCMEACRTQILQAPFSVETVEMLKGIPKLIKDKSPVVFEHPEVQNWLEAIRRLVEAIHSRNDRKAEVNVTIKKFRDYDRKSREALDEIKSKLAELSKCDHQVGILRARSEDRFKALCLKTQLMREQRDRLSKEVHDLNVRIAQEESVIAQEHIFGVKLCVAPWTFPEVVSMLEPIVVNLTGFVQQDLSSENLECELKERVDASIRLWGRMVCNSRVVEASTMDPGRAERL